MAKAPYPPDLLRVPFKGKLDAENRAWLEDTTRESDMTDRLDAALLHLRLCPKAFALDLPERSGKKAVVNARLDSSHAAWIAEAVRHGRFPDRVAAVNYAVTHARVCRQPLQKLQQLHGASTSRP